MPTYVSLMKLTEQGLKDIKNFPKRLDAAKKGMEAVGGRMVGFYAVMGKYDYVVITEMPSDEVGMSFLMSLGAMGNLRTTTLKAFTEKEFAKIVKKMT
jgi:uncharacterized protein with GYD domain